jgi:hypothetical protein
MGWPVRRAVAGPLAALAMLAALALAPPARADDDDRKIRSLTADLPARGIARIELKLAIGSVRIEPSPDDQVHVDLAAWCSTDKFGCEDEADELSLRQRRDGDRLIVAIDGFQSLRLGLTVRGTVQVPKGRALEVDLPIGELKIRGVTGDLDAEVGCGEIGVVLREHDVHTVRLGVGIGEATLSVAGRHIEGSGWLGQKVRWYDGAGPARVAVNLGVGDLSVRLD